MAQIRQDPQKLREFCDQLDGHIVYWQSSVGNLENHLARLGSSWRDDQFDDFARAVMLMRGLLGKFAENTQRVTTELRRDADILENSLHIQL